MGDARSTKRRQRRRERPKTSSRRPPKSQCNGASVIIGLVKTAIDCHGLPWTAMICHRLPWHSWSPCFSTATPQRKIPPRSLLRTVTRQVNPFSIFDLPIKALTPLNFQASKPRSCPTCEAISLIELHREIGCGSCGSYHLSGPQSHRLA